METMSTYAFVEQEPHFQYELWWAQLPPETGVMTGGKRPVIVLGNNIGNKYSPSVLITVVSSSMTKKPMPTHVKLTDPTLNLPKESHAQLEMIATIDKWCLLSKIGMLDDETVSKVKRARNISFGD